MNQKWENEIPGTTYILLLASYDENKSHILRMKILGWSGENHGEAMSEKM